MTGPMNIQIARGSSCTL